MNYLQRKKLAFMSIVNQVKGFVRTVLGVPPLTLLDCVDDKSIIDYKIYGNSIQDGEPTPDNPIEVESVGEKTINLWGKNTTTAFTATNLTYEWDNDGGLYFYNTGSIGKTLDTELALPSGVYSICSCIDKPVHMYKNGTLVGGSAKFRKITLEEEGTIKIRTFDHVGGSTTYLKYMVIEGEYTEDTMPNFEPQGKYKIPVKVSGKNLFNINNMSTIGGLVVNGDGSITCSGYPASSGKTLSQLCPNLKVGQTVTFSMKTNGVKDIYIRHPSTNTNIYWTNASSKTITEELLNSTVYFYRQTTAQGGGDAIISDIQFEDGVLKTEYEPYVEPVTKDIFLDEPLRKVGGYADYIDFENGKIVRNVFCKTFNGSEGIAVPGMTIEGYTPFKYIETNSITYPFICNYLPFVNSNYESVSNIECLSRYTTNGRQMFFTISNDRIPLNDITAFKNWLKELNANGNPLKIYACLNASNNAEPIELPNLPTFKGTTIYSIGTAIQPSNMEVTYYSTSKE